MTIEVVTIQDPLTVVVDGSPVTVQVSEAVTTVAVDENAIPPALSVQFTETPVQLDIGDPSTSTTVVDTETLVVTVSEGPPGEKGDPGDPGPPGPPGPPGGEEEVLNQVADIEADTPTPGITTIYKGWAQPTSGNTAAAVWRIQRQTLNEESDITSSFFADNNDNFDNVWDDRASLSYG